MPTVQWPTVSDPLLLKLQGTCTITLVSDPNDVQYLTDPGILRDQFNE